MKHQGTARVNIETTATLIITIALILLLPSSASAYWSGPVKIDPPPNFEAEAMDCTVNDRGVATVLYDVSSFSDQFQAVKRDLFVSRYSANGVRITTPQRISTPGRSCFTGTITSFGSQKHILWSEYTCSYSPAHSQWTYDYYLNYRTMVSGAIGPVMTLRHRKNSVIGKNMKGGPNGKNDYPPLLGAAGILYDKDGVPSFLWTEVKRLAYDWEPAHYSVLYMKEDGASQITDVGANTTNSIGSVSVGQGPQGSSYILWEVVQCNGSTADAKHSMVLLGRAFVNGTLGTRRFFDCLVQGANNGQICSPDVKMTSTRILVVWSRSWFGEVNVSQDRTIWQVMNRVNGGWCSKKTLSFDDFGPRMALRGTVPYVISSCINGLLNGRTYINATNTWSKSFPIAPDVFPDYLIAGDSCRLWVFYGVLDSGFDLFARGRWY